MGSLDISTQPDPDTEAAIIAAQNDAFRKYACLGTLPDQPIPGRLMITQSLTAADDGFVLQALHAVGSFDQFDPDNDPEGRHDFGAVEIQGENVIWKLDLYEADTEFRWGAETPTDPAKTIRVLNIMLASDW